MEEVQVEKQDGDKDPLLILGKIEDMMLYAYPVLNAYPKYERFVLAADIKRCMDQAMERTIEANKKYYKKIKKAQKAIDYKNAVNSLFIEQDIIKGAGLFNNEV